MGSGHHAATAGQHADGVARIGEVGVDAEIAVVGKRLHDPVLPRRLRDAKARVVHAKAVQHVGPLVVV